MAHRGFLVFCVNHRLANDEVKVTQQIQDISLAALWIHDNLLKYGGDTERVYLSGHSAGAVLAVMESLIVQSARLRAVYSCADKGFERYQGLILDCGMLSFYQKSVGYWGMRSIAFERGYKRLDTYRNMLWEQLPELALLPRVFLVSNAKDELRQMTLEFERLLTARGVQHTLNYQDAEILGHVAILYNTEKAKCAEILDEAAHYLLNR